MSNPKFFAQIGSNSCQISALKTVLSCYNIYPNSVSIRKKLPRHSYGNSIGELQILLENEYRISTKLVNSQDSEESDFEFCPAILNIGITTKKGTCPHFVVAIKDMETYLVYDGLKHSEPHKIDFNNLKNLSKNIDGKGREGEWLFCGKRYATIILN